MHRIEMYSLRRQSSSSNPSLQSVILSHRYVLGKQRPSGGHWNSPSSHSAEWSTHQKCKTTTLSSFYRSPIILWCTCTKLSQHYIEAVGRKNLTFNTNGPAKSLTNPTAKLMWCSYLNVYTILPLSKIVTQDVINFERHGPFISEVGR